MKKVRILEVTHGLAPGGIEAFVLNIFENIDKDNFEVNFAVAADGRQFHEGRVEASGGKVFHTSDLNGIVPMLKHAYHLFRLLKTDGPYDVVHSHIDFFNGINLLVAFLAKVPIRISHSHNTHSAGATTSKVSTLRGIYRFVMRNLINIFSTKRVGCSELANIYMYGKNVVDSGKTTVIPNGVDFSKFYLNPDLKVPKDSIELITIGRMCEQKNSLFIVEVMKCLSLIDSNYHLTWIGKGPYEEKIKKLISRYELNEHITLIGNSNDIPEFLSKSDFFLFPSKWEGLPVVLVESQISGLPCFISNTITHEVDLGLINSIDINKGADYFAREVNNLISTKTYNYKLDLERSNLFNIINVVNQVSSLYRES